MARRKQNKPDEYAELILVKKWGDATYEFYEALDRIEARAALAMHLAAELGTEDLELIFERETQAALSKAVDALSSFQIDRTTFDALPVHTAGGDRTDEMSPIAGMCRMTLRGYWFLLLSKSNGSALMFRPDFGDGKPLLN